MKMGLHMESHYVVNYIAMLTHYPEQVNTCPSRQSVLQSGDVFSLPVTFLDRNVTFILNIKIE